MAELVLLTGLATGGAHLAYNYVSPPNIVYASQEVAAAQAINPTVVSGNWLVHLNEFNVGGDWHPKYGTTPPSLDVQAKFLQACFRNQPDAPITEVTEAGTQLSHLLVQDAIKSGHCQIVYPGNPNAISAVLGRTLFQQDIALVIPDEYKILNAHAIEFKGRATQFARDFGEAVESKGKWSAVNSLAIDSQNRGLVIVRLQAPNGAVFTVVAGHTAFDPTIRSEELPQIIEALKQVIPDGPVVLVMDSNTRDPETDASHDPKSHLFYFDIEHTGSGFVNLGPWIGTSGAAHIDDVLLAGNLALADQKAGRPPTFVTLNQAQVGIPGYLHRANSDHKTVASSFTLFSPNGMTKVRAIAVWHPGQGK
jgi:hypothetical protein